MAGEAEQRQPEPEPALRESTTLKTLGKIVGSALVGGVGVEVSAGVVCSCIISAFPIRGDDWTIVLPRMLAIIGLIDGAFYGYRRSRQNTESTEQALSKIGVTKQLPSDVICATGGYVVWAIFGLVAGGWVGVFRYGSFWGHLIGPATTLGIRFFLLWLVGLIPRVVGLAMKRISDSGMGPTIGVRMTAIFLLVLAVCSIGFPFACVLRYKLMGYYSPRLWSEYLPYEIVFLPLGILLISISYGLWRRRRWVRPVGLTFFWVVAVGSTIGVLVGLFMATQTSGWGLGIVLVTTAAIAAVAVPAWLLVWYFHRIGRS